MPVVTSDRHLTLNYKINSIFDWPIAFFSEPRPPVNPCDPSPCGPNSVCQVRGEFPACSCLEAYIGAPPNCRPECIINPECNPELSCINQRCRDPCPGSCGPNALCRVVNHNAVCSCSPGFIGDPFNGCVPEPGRILNVYCMLLDSVQLLTSEEFC